MIHTDRKKMPPPNILLERGPKALEQIEAFYAAETNLQSSYPWQGSKELFSTRPVRQALDKLFHSKCAFCEVVMTSTGLSDVGHFRPYKGTSNLYGEFFPEHYWWLAYEWENLYPICSRCSRAKRNIFPVAGSYGEVGTPYAELIQQEEPMIIDPCRDKPGQFFVYNESGEIAPNEGQHSLKKLSQKDYERAVNTIEVFKLHRKDLSQARREKYRQFRRTWEAVQERKDEASQQQLIAMTEDNAEYSALCKQFLLQWLRHSAGVEPLWNAMRGFVHRWQGDYTGASSRSRKASFRSERARAKEQSSYSLLETSETKRRKLLLTDQTITSLEVKNLRGIKDLHIDASTAAESAPWFMFLGENGVGKSTLLHAITLALIDAEYRKKLQVDPRTFVRKGCRRGHVKIELSDFDEPILLEFRSNSQLWRGSDTKPRIPVLAFGSTRLMAQEGVRSPRAYRRSSASVDNLFNPFIALDDPTEWLLGLKKAQFSSLVRSIKKLLDLPPRAQFKANRRRKVIEIPSLNVRSLAELSDGYRTVIAMVVEIMKVLLKHFNVVETAKGIVIIDELGAHLHPRWRMRVVANLRNAFPNIQFIASSHDPLCLRGLEDGETVVLRRFGRTVDAVPDLPNLAGLRIDQILTSEHFGLSTTVDPEVEQVFEEYYALLDKPSHSEDDELRIQELQRMLDEMNLMGETRREKMMLQAIDRHLAQAEQNVDGTDLNAELARLMEA